jgi:ribosome maturation factor RimP
MATKFNEKLIKNAIEDKFTEICAKILPVEGYGVYDLRYLSGSSTLRVFITKGDSVKVLILTIVLRLISFYLQSLMKNHGYLIILS